MLFGSRSILLCSALPLFAVAACHAVAPYGGTAGDAGSAPADAVADGDGAGPDATPRPDGASPDGGVVWPPGTNLRSIGGAGTLLEVGHVTVTAGSDRVTFGGGASLGDRVGAGDRLVIAPGTAEAEPLYLASRDSATGDLTTGATLQRPAGRSHQRVAFRLERAYATIGAWEADRQGDLVADQRNEVGLCYADGPFDELVVIEGSRTDADHRMVLTVAEGSRHGGRAGQGARLEPSTAGHAIAIEDDHTRVAWLEVTGWSRGAKGSFDGINITAEGVEVDHVLVHDDGSNSSSDANGITLEKDNGSATVTASVVYGVARACIAIHNVSGATLTVEGCTVARCNEHDSPDRGGGVGVFVGSGKLVVHRTIAVGSGSGGADFHGVEGDFNLSSDGSAPGEHAWVGVEPAALFVNLATGAEDLHLRAGAPAIDRGGQAPAGATDVDGVARAPHRAADIGADEHEGPAPGWPVEPTAAGEHARSIGTHDGPLVASGGATVAAGQQQVLFEGPVLPAKVGRGDRLVLRPGEPGEAVAYVDAVLSPASLRLQRPVSAGHGAVTFRLERAYRSIGAWETARGGDLVASARREIGVLHDDGPFDELVVIGGSVTGPKSYLALEAAPRAGEREIGSGPRLVPSRPGHGLRIHTPYTRVVGLEVSGWSTDTRRSYDGINIRGDGVLIDRVIVHDDESGGDSDCNGITVEADGVRAEVRNSMIYNVARSGVAIHFAQNAGLVLRNVTLFRCVTGDNSPERYGCVSMEGTKGAKLEAVNVIAVGATAPALAFNVAAATIAGGSANNLSDDGTAPGASPVAASAEALFRSTLPGSEDLHLEVGAVAIDAGLSLSGLFAEDIDREPRGASWDIGADER